MRQALTIFVIFLVITSSLFARKTKPKSGKIHNGIYTDLKYDFQLNIPDNWKIKLSKIKNPERFTLVQKNHKIPPRFQQYPQAAEIPKAHILVDEIPFAPSAFIDSLLSESFSSKIKDKIMAKILVYEEGVTFEGITNGIKRTLLINDRNAVYWTGVAKYKISMGGSSFIRKIGIAFIAIKNDNLLMMNYWGGEEMYIGDISNEMLVMLKTLRWND